MELVGRALADGRRRPPCRRLVTSVLVSVMGAGLLTGCYDRTTADVGGRVDVVASTDVWGSIASAVGGSRVSVTAIINEPGQDPHSYEASTRTVLEIDEAELIVVNGGGYDDFMDQMISSSGTDAAVVDAVALSGHDDDPAGGELNEHVWYDLPTAARVADAIAAELAGLAPRHAAEFTANAKAFSMSLRGLMATEQRVKAADGGAGVGITEPVPLYMLKAMGLLNRTPVDFSTAVEEGGDVSPRALADTLALYTHHQVALLVYNDQTSGPVTEQVKAAAVSAGIAVVAVTETLPVGTTYVAWMRRNVAAVAEALSPR